MRIYLAAFLIPALAACGGDIETHLAPVPSDQIGVMHSALAREAAHETILLTRPQSTDLLLQHLNMVLANNSILDTTVADVEERMLAPLTSGEAELSCPYLSSSGADTSISCRYLVDQALEKATLDSGYLMDDMEQQVAGDHGSSLAADELSWVNGWIQEAVLSGIDAGAVHTVEVLR